MQRTFTRLDEQAIDAICSLFATQAVVEPYSADGSPVYRLSMTGAADGLQLVLWPSLSRVDVSSASDHSWVLKNVGEVDVIEGVEAVFRPAEGRGYLFVAVNGFVNMVMG